MRPYNWETQLSIQQQVAPRVSVYAGYSRRWFGNLFATQNTAVTNASYTPYCIGVPTAPSVTGVCRCRMRGGQQCGYFDLIRPTTADQPHSEGGQLRRCQDVYDGIDFDANARLGKGLLVNGGVSWGRERFNSLRLQGQRRHHASVRRVGSFEHQHAATRTAYCDVHPPFQPNVKGQLTYPFPWGIGGSISFQSLPGAQIVANYPLTNTTPGLTLGRTFSSVAPSVSMVQPGRCIWIGSTRRTSGSRRTFSYRATTIRPTVSVYNLFNANPTNTNNALPDDLRRGVAGADGHHDAALRGLRPADQLLEVR